MSNVIRSEATEVLQLSPVLSRRFALRLRHLLLALGAGVAFSYYNYIPLFHTDLWGHVAYGYWILDHRQLPVEDPFVRLAEGVTLVDTAWLGQVLLALADKVGGNEWLSHLFALTALATYLVLTRVFYDQCGRLSVAMFGAVFAWLVAGTRHAIIRPEMFGGLCFALLLWVVVLCDANRSRRPGVSEATPRSTLWPAAAIALIFAAWANLHGSFVVGFAVLGCSLGGRALEVLASARSLWPVFQDAEVRRKLLLLEAAVSGTLLNPYGIDLLIYTFLFPSNPNLNDVVEWYRLNMVSYEGIQVGISWLLMLIAFRHSRVRIKPADVLLLCVFTLAVCLRVRMVTWYAPVVAMVLVPHFADVAARAAKKIAGPAALRSLCRRYPSIGEPLVIRSFRFTVLAVFTVWVCFAFSPISRVVLGGKARPPQHLYSRGTPLALTEYLHQHPPEGQIFNPQWWGDWLSWKGPAGLQVFMTSNAVHVAPQQVWKDYLATARGQAGIEQRLNRYRVNTVIVHKELQLGLTRAMRSSANWKIIYEDDLALVAQRVGSQSPLDEQPGPELAGSRDARG
jgi:hypothetical protein